MVIFQSLKSHRMKAISRIDHPQPFNPVPGACEEECGRNIGSMEEVESLFKTGILFLEALAGLQSAVDSFAFGLEDGKLSSINMKHKYEYKLGIPQAQTRFYLRI